MKTDDLELDRALRLLDPADASLTPAQQAHKQELLTSVLHEPVPATTATTHPAFRRRRVARWAVPIAAAAALTGVFVLTQGPGDSTAYASWTPKPQPVTGSVAAEAAQACRKSMHETVDQQVDQPDGPESLATRPETARTLMVEQRGYYLFLAMATDDGSTAQCFFDADEPSRVKGSSGGYTTVASGAPKPMSARQIEANGQGMSSGPEGTYAFTEGRTGNDVRAVTLRTEGRRIDTTVGNGYYAAWWPSSADPTPNGAMPNIAYDITLKDGTVLTNVTPVRR